MRRSTITLLSIMIVFSSCNQEEPNFEEVDCFKSRVGTQIGNSNTTYGILVDDDNEKLYYFDNHRNGLVTVDIISGIEEPIKKFSGLSQFLPLDVVGKSLLVSIAGIQPSTQSIIIISLDDYSTFEIEKEASNYVPIFDDNIIIYRDTNGKIVVSDFAGSKTILDLVAEPLSLSENGDELLIRKQLPNRIFVYNLLTNDKEYIKHENTVNKYYWFNNEIHELVINEKELSVNNLTTNTQIRYIKDYGFGYHLSTKSNKICLINELVNTICENQRFILTIDDLNIDRKYDIAESGEGHFTHLKIYDNGNKIVYWWYNSESYYIDEL